MSSGTKLFYVIKWKVFIGWPELSDVGIHAYDKEGNLFAFDLTADQAIQLGTQLVTSAFTATRYAEEYNEHQKKCDDNAKS